MSTVVTGDLQRS